MDIQTARTAVERKGGLSGEPGQPRFFVSWPKTLLKLTMGIQLIEGAIREPDQRVKR
jgi:hypothetical protein